jgi:hypothetical protein
LGLFGLIVPADLIKSLADCIILVNFPLGDPPLFGDGDLLPEGRTGDVLLALVLSESQLLREATRRLALAASVSTPNFKLLRMSDQPASAVGGKFRLAARLEFELAGLFAE